MYVTRNLRVRFVTPAFLGNAEQQAQWRTPPIKALLRQWWRVAAAEGLDFKYERLREREATLFGHAWLENDRDSRGRKVNGRKSSVTIRFSNWAGRQPSNWPGGPMEQVVTTRDGKGRVRSDLYLGYGAVLPPSKKEGRSAISLRAGGAIAEGEENQVALRFPGDGKLEETLQLIGWFGSLGSRSRNGWGSLQVEGQNLPRGTDIEPFSRPFSECMSLDWPHALGRDELGALCWVTTEPKKGWREVIGTLARIKVAVRAEAKRFKDRSGIGGVHLLGYPAGAAWELREFPGTARLAAQLRFKVFQTQSGLAGIVYHLPAKLPSVLRNRLTEKQKRWLDSNELAVWEAVHGCLDNDSRIQRLP